VPERRFTLLYDGGLHPQQGALEKRGASVKLKRITSSPVTVLMSWCMLNTFTPTTSWTIDSNIGRANSSSCSRVSLMRSFLSPATTSWPVAVRQPSKHPEGGPPGGL